MSKIVEQRKGSDGRFRKKLTLFNIINEPDLEACRSVRDYLVKHHFKYGLHGEWPEQEAVSVAAQILWGAGYGGDDSGSVWLRDHNYLIEGERCFKAGQSFRRGYDTLVLVRVGSRQISLISMISWNRWKEPLTVTDPTNIPESVLAEYIGEWWESFEVIDE